MSITTLHYSSCGHVPASYSNLAFYFWVWGEAYSLTGRCEAIEAYQQALTYKPEWIVRLFSHQKAIERRKEYA